ncbi:MAG: nicotinate-nucleotide adenylyltransferase [Thermoleophilia bacterium]
MSTARRVGVLGGAFDPPHIGHVILAQEAWWRLRLDLMLLVPVGTPTDRPAPRFDAGRRVRMVEAAVAGHPGLACSRVEVDRDGPSYTADTLELIAREHPGAELWFMLGADRLETLPAWHDPARLLSLARIAVVPRAGWSAERIRETADRVAPGRVDVVEAPEIGVSSTMVRRRLEEGAPVRYLVPEGVEPLLRD